ncbi:MAG TPA: NTP transferase domain-containing protein [Candidatus Sumerlaeota bacterium]|nr:NTP transferase domain-containing protein [Candidatus Sumerlaeota bacterium]HOR29553.1 NTP transferase domain-containing protein [Candidatus Sumerlaeota bacterium]HPK02698.1 NTP transferase domain-containing protein [Candidatus Sumerlaeota bacterium]
MTPTDRPLAAVIIAAGQGKRMRSRLPKVLHEIAGRPMIDYPLGAVEAVGVERIFVVVGNGGDLVRAHVGGRALCVDQPERLGTGHAVKMAAPHLGDFHGDVLILYGDTPLLMRETLQRLIDTHRERRGAGVLLAATLRDPTGYGRIHRDANGAVLRIIEEKDCTPEQRLIREANVGAYCFDCRRLLEGLDLLQNNNAQGEYYLTDVPEKLRALGHAVYPVQASDESEVLGVNSRAQLAEVAVYLRRRVLNRLMDEGVTIVDPATTYIDQTVAIGPDTVVEPFTILRGDTTIGERCRIGPGAELIDARVGHGVHIRHSVVHETEIPDGARVGPFAWLRPQQAPQVT